MSCDRSGPFKLMAIFQGVYLGSGYFELMAVFRVCIWAAGTLN